MEFDLAITDELLTTTRAVRKRLDLTRDVPRALINDCLELAIQAPTGSNAQTWRWLVVDDAEKRKALADLYRRAGTEYLTQSLAMTKDDTDKQNHRVFSSAVYLLEHLHEAPVHLIPCLQGSFSDTIPLIHASGIYGSIYPAIWSFQLAARARGLGTALTTLHLAYAKEAADILGLPDDILQVALLPVAYTLGTDFKRAKRSPVAEITHWNTW